MEVTVVIGMIAAVAMAASAAEDVSVPVRPGCSGRGAP